MDVSIEHHAQQAGRPRTWKWPGTGGLQRVLALALVALMAAGFAITWHRADSSANALDAQARSAKDLQARVKVLEQRVGSQPDWAAITLETEPSVFTIEAKDYLGSGWVAHSDARGSDLITNFHVVEEAWTAGVFAVDVRQGDSYYAGTITDVDRNNDLAVVHVAAALPPLKVARFRPLLAAPVMALGSPLGLGGSISVGLISGSRSLEGGDYLQFTAPISPGNSGGPVVDSHGHVVAVATAKFEGLGVEALSLGIPVQIACSTLVICDVA